MYATLTQCPLFRGLTADEIRRLIGSDQSKYTLTDYAPGELIARRDTAYSGLMIVLEGRVRGQMTDPSGRVIPVDSLGAPQLIAPAFLFGGYNRLPVDVIAEGPVRIMTLHRGLLFELMQENMLMLSNFIDIISNRANLWSLKMYFLSLRSVQQKLAAYLLEHSSEGASSLSLPELAELTAYFNVTRSAVDGALGELEKKKLVRREGSRLEVLDRAGLQGVMKDV